MQPQPLTTRGPASLWEVTMDHAPSSLFDSLDLSLSMSQSGALRRSERRRTLTAAQAGLAATRAAAAAEEFDALSAAVSGGFGEGGVRCSGQAAAYLGNPARLGASNGVSLQHLHASPQLQTASGDGDATTSSNSYAGYTQDIAVSQYSRRAATAARSVGQPPLQTGSQGPSFIDDQSVHSRLYSMRSSPIFIDNQFDSPAFDRLACGPPTLAARAPSFSRNKAHSEKEPSAKPQHRAASVGRGAFSVGGGDGASVAWSEAAHPAPWGKGLVTPNEAERRATLTRRREYEAKLSAERERRRQTAAQALASRPQVEGQRQAVSGFELSGSGALPHSAPQSEGFVSAAAVSSNVPRFPGPPLQPCLQAQSSTRLAHNFTTSPSNALFTLTEEEQRLNESLQRLDNHISAKGAPLKAPIPAASSSNAQSTPSFAAEGPQPKQSAALHAPPTRVTAERQQQQQVATLGERVARLRAASAGIAKVVQPSTSSTFGVSPSALPPVPPVFGASPSVSSLADAIARTRSIVQQARATPPPLRQSLDAQRQVIQKLSTATPFVRFAPPAPPALDDTEAIISRALEETLSGGDDDNFHDRGRSTAIGAPPHWRTREAAHLYSTRDMEREIDALADTPDTIHGHGRNRPVSPKIARGIGASKRLPSTAGGVIQVAGGDTQRVQSLLGLANTKVV